MRINREKAATRSVAPGELGSSTVPSTEITRPQSSSSHPPGPSPHTHVAARGPQVPPRRASVFARTAGPTVDAGEDQATAPNANSGEAPPANSGS